ncbi:general substrate transporter [Talaromyces proteolyticus]|uniref:General substrate transporter n=1 Tax=Talaromyces proteolyticus TaxID=1131652 RepID=A0AAD4KVX7_9EURO|nr:general substrate transporter [Talaromyces proteolyticus]KAH8702208.1 general substrate transporter [Talaromyces proteolyticus]
MGFQFDKARYFNRTLVFSVFIIAVSTFNYGFDNQAFATTQSMNTFTKQFGEYNSRTHAYNLNSRWLSLFNSLNYVGFAAGVIIGSFVSARFGRRWCMFTMSLYALVSATITVTSNTRQQIMAGRILNYVYVGMELSVVPNYQSEIVPAPVRGFIVGTYQLCIGLGGVIINAICYRTSHIEDNRGWRIPLGLFYIVPSIIAASIFFIPESPRWLLQRNRVEEAKASIQQLRQGAFTEEEIENEFKELEFALVNEVEKGKFVELFQGKNLKRTLIVVAINFFQQATGQAFSSQYGGVYVRSLGIFNPQLFTLMSSCIGCGIMLCTLFVTDKVGRRKLLIFSSVIIIGALMTMGGLGINEPVTTSRMKGIISMIVIFGVGFSCGWGPLTYVVATEVSSLRLRDHTSRVGFGVNVCFNFAVNFAVPYLVFADEADLGSRVGFIFGAVALLSLVFTFFCVPECKGKTLEQVDWLFNNNVRLRDFGKVDATRMLGDATYVVKI